MNGVLLVDKSLGFTSHDVVAYTRRLLQIKKVGHLGTLDPLATGLLVLCLGKATRLAKFMSGWDKVYIGTVRLSHSTTTYDLEGEPLGKPTEVRVEKEEIINLLSGFKGRIKQMPPQFSAKKVAGRPIHRYARRGLRVDIEPVEVEIYQIKLLKLIPNQLWLKVSCSAGTYVRSLAHDIGQTIGCGGYLSYLRRVRFGSFSLADAIPMDQLFRFYQRGKLQEKIIPLETLLPEFPPLTVDSRGRQKLLHGMRLSRDEFQGKTGETPIFNCKGYYKALDQGGKLVAIGRLVQPGGSPGVDFQPEVVIDDV